MTRIVDEAFPNHQFTGYKMIKIDRKKHGGTIMFYINGNIPYKIILTSPMTVKSL